MTEDERSEGILWQKAERLRTILSTQALGSPSCIVDLGTGDGTLPQVLHELFPGGQIIAIDRKVGFARRRCAELQGDVQFIEADVTATGLQAGSADMVILHQMFHHLSPTRIESVLIEAARILGTNGQLCVIEADASPVNSRQQLLTRVYALEAVIDLLAEKQPEMFFTKDQVKQLLECGGYTIVHEQDFPQLVSPIGSEQWAEMKRELQSSIARLPLPQQTLLLNKFTELAEQIEASGLELLPVYLLRATCHK